VAAQLTQANPGMAALLDEGGGRRGQQELMAAVRPRRLEPWESGLVPVALALTEKTVPTGCLNDAPCPPCTSHSASIRRRVNGQVHAYLALKVHDVIVGALRRAYVYEDVAFHTKVARLRAAREQAEAEAQHIRPAQLTQSPRAQLTKTPRCGRAGRARWGALADHGRWRPAALASHARRGLPDPGGRPQREPRGSDPRGRAAAGPHGEQWGVFVS
jgi:hypothetical protein